MATAFVVRDAEPGDVPFLGRMLLQANHVEAGPDQMSLARALREPMLGRYLVGWGRSGDTGVVAVGANGARRGAAWYRLMDPAAPGWATLDADTPELTIAVSRRHRGKGLGTALLAALLERARAQGRPGVSLSVSLANPAALRLYRAAGFETLSEGHGWATMVWRPTFTE